MMNVFQMSSASWWKWSLEKHWHCLRRAGAKSAQRRRHRSQEAHDLLEELRQDVGCMPAIQNPTHPKQSTSGYHRLLQVSEVAFHPHVMDGQNCALPYGVSICLNRSFMKGGLKFQIWIFMPLNRSGQRMICQTWKQWRKGALLYKASLRVQVIRVWSHFGGVELRKSFLKASRSAMPRELPLYTIYSQPGQCRSASCEMKSSLPQKKR